jgi:hypothetical protein
LQAAQSRADSSTAAELHDDEVYAEDSDSDDFVYEDHAVAAVSHISQTTAAAAVATAGGAASGSNATVAAAVKSAVELRSCMCELLSGLNYSCFSALSAAQWKVSNELH